MVLKAGHLPIQNAYEISGVCSLWRAANTGTADAHYRGSLEPRSDRWQMFPICVLLPKWGIYAIYWTGNLLTPNPMVASNSFWNCLQPRANRWLYIPCVRRRGGFRFASTLLTSAI